MPPMTVFTVLSRCWACSQEVPPAGIPFPLRGDEPNPVAVELSGLHIADKPPSCKDCKPAASCCCCCCCWGLRAGRPGPDRPSRLGPAKQQGMLGTSLDGALSCSAPWAKKQTSRWQLSRSLHSMVRNFCGCSQDSKTCSQAGDRID